MVYAYNGIISGIKRNEVLIRATVRVSLEMLR